VVTRSQLLALGLSSQGIKHRQGRGRLHVVHRGVYAVGRPELSRDGLWMAAVLAVGRGAVLSHSSAAALWGIGEQRGPIEVSVAPPRTVARPGIRVHRRQVLEAEQVLVRRGIAVTGPLQTLVDISPRMTPGELEDAIGRVDRVDLCNPEQLLEGVLRLPRGPGVGRLREVLERRTLTLTDSELERRMLPIVRRAGLGPPRTQQLVNGYRVDFYWPELGLVVETDGLRYHRTAAQQSADHRRDQAHAAAGLTPLRFSHAQVTYQPAGVEAVLRRVAARLAPPD
jgi:very-short-patch-repair endonuclease